LLKVEIDLSNDTTDADEGTMAAILDDNDMYPWGTQLVARSNAPSTRNCRTSCTVNVTFTPTIIQTRSGTLTASGVRLFGRLAWAAR
jgi:hypothetical protein